MEPEQLALKVMELFILVVLQKKENFSYAQFEDHLLGK